MQERLAGLVAQRGGREEEAVKRAREAEERGKAAHAALQAAHRQHQVPWEAALSSQSISCSQSESH